MSKENNNNNNNANDMDKEIEEMVMQVDDDNNDENDVHVHAYGQDESDSSSSSSSSSGKRKLDMSSTRDEMPSKKQRSDSGNLHKKNKLSDKDMASADLNEKIRMANSAALSYIEEFNKTHLSHYPPGVGRVDNSVLNNPPIHDSLMVGKKKVTPPVKKTAPTQVPAAVNKKATGEKQPAVDKQPAVASVRGKTFTKATIQKGSSQQIPVKEATKGTSKVPAKVVPTKKHVGVKNNTNNNNGIDPFRRLNKVIPKFVEGDLDHNGVPLRPEHIRKLNHIIIWFNYRLVHRKFNKKIAGLYLWSLEPSLGKTAFCDTLSYICKTYTWVLEDNDWQQDFKTGVKYDCIIYNAVSDTSLRYRQIELHGDRKDIAVSKRNKQICDHICGDTPFIMTSNKHYTDLGYEEKHGEEMVAWKARMLIMTLDEEFNLFPLINRMIEIYNIKVKGEDPLPEDLEQLEF